MQIAPSAFGQHEQSAFCQDGKAQKAEHEAAINSARALEHQFMAYRVVLNRVKVFKYLGCLLAYDDNNVQAVRANLRKTRRC